MQPISFTYRDIRINDAYNEEGRYSFHIMRLGKKCVYQFTQDSSLRMQPISFVHRDIRTNGAYAQ